MDLMSSLQNGLDELRPSLFDLHAENQLSQLIPPALRYLLAISTYRHPRYLLPVLNTFDEVYALVMLLVERHFLRTYGGSFTEHFYGLKRARVLRIKGGEAPRAQLAAPEYVREAVKLQDGDVWKNLAVLVGIPYLKRKLDEGYDMHAAHQNILGTSGYRPERDALRPRAGVKERFLWYYKWFLRHVYPSVNAAYYFSLLVFNVAYLFNGTKYHSPFLWLIETRIRRLGAADLRAIELAASATPTGNRPGARPGEGGSVFALRSLARSVYPRLLASLRLIIPTSILALNFLDWWHASDFARQLSRKAAENFQLPPPVLPVLTTVSAETKSTENVDHSLPNTTDEKAATQASKSGVHMLTRPPVSESSRLPILTVSAQTGASSHLCPICTLPINTPTATPSGYVYCYTCIHRWIEGDHERQVAFMEGSVGFKWNAGEDESSAEQEEGWGAEEGSREGRWESGKGRDAVTGRIVLGGTEGLRRVVA